MNKQEYVELEVTQYETRQNEPMPSHNKSVLRGILSKEWDWYEGEEARTLNDNHRYHDDI